MNITFTKSRTTAALGALLLLVAAVGGAMAAAPTVDTETTDTTTTSALTDGATVTDFNASDTNISTLQAAYDSTNPGIAIVDPETGDTLKTITNESQPGYFTQTGTGTGVTYYNTTFSESDFATVPMAAGENKSVTLRLINDTSVPADQWDTTNVTITLDNTDERAVVTASASSEADGVAEIEEKDSILPDFLTSEENLTTVEQDNLGINGSATTVYVVYEDDGVDDAFEDAAENKSRLGISALASDYESGDRIRDHIVRVDDTPYAVFSESVADDIPGDTTYAVYTTVDGEPAHELTLGDEFDGESNVDVETTGNDVLGLGDFVQTDGVGIFGVSLTSGLAGAVLLLFGRPAVEGDA